MGTLDTKLAAWNSTFFTSYILFMCQELCVHILQFQKTKSKWCSSAISCGDQNTIPRLIYRYQNSVFIIRDWRSRFLLGFQWVPLLTLRIHSQISQAIWQGLRQCFLRAIRRITYYHTSKTEVAISALSRVKIA